MATEPLLCGGGHMWYIILAVLGVPNAHREKEIKSAYLTPPVLGVPSAQCEEEIRSGYLTPAVLGARMWAKWLHNPCHLGGPQRAVGEEIRSGHLTLAVCVGGGGGICGQSGYITPTISGGSNGQRGEEIRIGYLTPTVSGTYMWAK